MTTTSTTDVLIVGAGPVGLTLAHELARRDIACRIIDQLPTAQIEIRAKGLVPRTEEIFEDLGIIDQIHARGQRLLPFRFYEHARLVREVNPASDPANHPTPDAPYRGPFLISQAQTEAVLREHLASKSVQVEQDCQLVDVAQHADHVEAMVQRAGKSEVIQASFLVGCDGGHSTVRHRCDFAFLGETLESEHYLNGGLLVSGLDPAYAHDWTSPGEGMLYLTPLRYDGIWVFQAPISPDEDDTSLETFQRIFAERASVPGVHLSDLRWASIWRPNIRMVNRYRNGRVLLAGDAAHVHSAAGGQGMNTGIGDAYNLGWKLAHMLRGAPDALLETYQAERLPVAQAVLATTTVRHQAFVHPDVSSNDPTGMQALINLTTSKDSIADTTQLSISYQGSRLSCDLDETTGIRAGDRAPDAPCIHAESGEPVRLFEVFRGTHFTLLAFSDQLAPRLPNVSNNFLRVYTVTRPGNTTTPDKHTLVDRDGHAYCAYGIPDEAFVLVRPDGYVGLTGGRFVQEPIIDYLRAVIGQ